MQSRNNLFSLPGGDTIQLTKTKDQLERMGIDVDISLDFKPDLSPYDIVHLSNLTRIQETYLQLINALKQNKPVVLSTIFWPMDAFEKNGQIGLRRIIGSLLSFDEQESIKAAARFITDSNSRNEATKSIWHIGYKKMQQFVANKVDYFLPNSEMEMNKLVEYFGIKKEKYTIVPNAIDKEVALKQMTNSIPDEFEKYQDAVICVGRIETRKNQLSLLRALEGTPYKVVLVGKPSANQTNYYKRVKKIIQKRSNYYHIEEMENERLYLLYRLCKVSALPSWLDTPGLVSLEAGAMGCNLAISSIGTTTEYFHDFAEYCEPNSIESIRMAVERAYNKAPNLELQSLITKNYTWEIAAEKTLEGYCEAMSRHRAKI